MTTPATARPRAVRDGVHDATSVVLGYVPFALALGAALGSTGVAPFTAWLSSALVFAGAAQLVTVQMLDAGAGAPVVILTALVVNARHLLYSASMVSYVRTWTRRDRWAAAYFLADPVYALADTRFRRQPAPDAGSARAYYFAMASTCWLAWLGLTAAGVLLADALPTRLPLDLAAPLTFLLLLLPTLDGGPARVAALTAGLVAVVASALPVGLGLLLGIFTGIAAGRLFATVRDRRSRRSHTAVTQVGQPERAVEAPHA